MEQCKLFDSLVGSILSYNAAIWGYHDANSIKLVHCKFLRRVLHVKRSTNTYGLYGELGRYPMRIRRQLLIMNYWKKILECTNPLISTVYNMLVQDANDNNSYGNLNWAFHIKKILCNIGLVNIWQEQYVDNSIMLSIKQRIKDIFVQLWHSDINNSTRLSFYRLFKSSFEMEEDLQKHINTRYQIILSRFRLYSNNLNIETGRYSGQEKDTRKCVMCNMKSVEDDYHFLLVCPKYQELRRKFFKRYYCCFPTKNKFILLMSSTNKNVILSIGKYLYYAFKMRQ